MELAKMEQGIWNNYEKISHDGGIGVIGWNIALLPVLFEQ